MSLYVLDSDTLSLYSHRHAAVTQNMLAHTPAELATTVINVEEMLTGWHSLLRAVKTRTDLAQVYDRLAKTVPLLAEFSILSFTEPAILRFEQLHATKLNVRKMDLRIAAIALEHSATLVTRNTRDFQRVPGLTLEDWTV